MLSLLGCGSLTAEEPIVGSNFSRREFLEVAGNGAAATALGLTGRAWAEEPGSTKSASQPAAAEPKIRDVADHTLITIAGTPRERGRQYGKQFQGPMQAFLEEEIIEICAKRSSRDKLLQFAHDCGERINSYSPTIADELAGMAEKKRTDFR